MPIDFCSTECTTLFFYFTDIIILELYTVLVNKINKCIYFKRVPGSSVGIATDYGLDGPGSNPVGDEIFSPSRPGLVPTQTPVKWVPSLSRG